MTDKRSFTKIKYHLEEAANMMESMKEDFERLPDEMSVDDAEALAHVTSVFNNVLLALLEFEPHWNKVFEVLEPLFKDFKKKNGIE